jgi:hypothetical protein
MIRRTSKAALRFPTTLAESLGRIFPTPDPQHRPVTKSWHGLHSMRALSRMQSVWQWLISKRAERQSSRELRLIETLPLGEKRFVATIEAGGARYLIGATAGQLSLLTRLDDQASPGTAPPGAVWEQP